MKHSRDQDLQPASSSVDPSIALAVLDSIDVVVLVVDDTGAIVFENQAAVLALRSPTAEAKTAQLLSRLRETAAQVRTSGQARSCRFEHEMVRWRCRLWPLSPSLVATASQRAEAPRTLTATVAGVLGVDMGDARLAIRVAQGEPNRRIAEAMDVPVGTVNSRLWRLYKRVGAKHRTDLAVRVSQLIREHHGAPDLDLAGVDPDAEM